MCSGHQRGYLCRGESITSQVEVFLKLLAFFQAAVKIPSTHSPLVLMWPNILSSVSTESGFTRTILWMWAAGVWVESVFIRVDRRADFPTADGPGRQLRIDTTFFWDNLALKQPISWECVNYLEWWLLIKDKIGILGPYIRHGWVLNI